MIGLPVDDGAGPAGVGAAVRPEAGRAAAPRAVPGAAAVGRARPAGAAGVRRGVREAPAAGASGRLIADCGHLAMFEKEAEFVEAVARFAARVNI